MSQYPRRRRFHRTPSDAHLLTPPNTKPYTYALHPKNPDLIHHPILASIMQEFGFRDHWSGSSPTTSAVISSLIRNGLAESITVHSYEGGFTHLIRITRRPNLSQSTLDRLPPLIRQRLKHSTL